MFATRVPFSIMAGTLCSIAIFVALARLVSVPFDVPTLAEARRIDFTPQRVVTPLEPPRPEKPQEPPPTLTVIVPKGPAVAGPRIEPLPRGPTSIARPPRTGVALGADRDVVPLVRIEPAYPARAEERGIQGWAQVRFTVTAAGTIRDAVVVASEPGEIFDEAALKAVARWRYNPRIDGGMAVERVGLETVFRFELDN
jgi:protein TonB